MVHVEEGHEESANESRNHDHDDGGGGGGPAAAAAAPSSSSSSRTRSSLKLWLSSVVVGRTRSPGRGREDRRTRSPSHA